ncbi:MAG: magnesium transporter [Pseudomonadota bacterium]
MDSNKEKIEYIENMIELSNKLEDVAVLLSELHPADIAEIIDNLEEGEKKKIFYLLNIEKASDVIVKINDNSRREILSDISGDKLTQMVDNMETDDAADIIGLLPDDRAEEILEKIDKEDSIEVQKLLQYEKETAGGIMQAELISVRENISVEEAIKYVRSLGERTEDFHNIFVTDEQNKLVGILPLRKLILTATDARISDVMTRDPIKVKVDVDQEEVAKIIQKYDLVSIPVTDESGTLFGRITIDDVVDVIEEETSEDFLKMAGMGEIEELVYSSRIFKISQKRLPWLLTNLLGGLLTGYLMWLFEVTIKDALALVTFIPVITGTGGNVGIQSSSIMVRGMAIGRIDLDNIISIIFKEMRIGAIIGLACGSVVGLVAPFWHGNSVLGFIVGFAMFIGITVASTMGAFIPAMFKKLNIDPAIASGPFVTTANDITGIVIYLSIATVFLKYII